MTNQKITETGHKSLLEKEAVAWFTRMNGKPTSEEKKDFANWLALSPDHLSIYEGVRDVWSDVGQIMATVAQTTDTDLKEPLEKVTAFRLEKKCRNTGALIVTFLGFLIISAWIWLEHPNLIQNLEADYISAKAERRSVLLADGSEVFLDADSAIAVKITTDKRVVKLLRGNANFNVKKDNIPFVVRTDEVEAFVTGTKFDVLLNNDGHVTVTLSQGSLIVSSINNEDKVSLEPGESVDYDNEGLGTKKSADLDESMAWHKGRLVFTNARLADVLARIERYRHGRIVLVGAGLGEKRVSGNISLENTETNLEAMQSLVGFKMTKLTEKIVFIAP